MKNFEFIFKNGSFFKKELDEDLTLADGEVLVEIKDVGICGSDLFSMEVAKENLELHLGHEWTGRVVSTKDLRFKENDLVTSPVIFGCGKCEQCLNDNENNCLQSVALGGTEIGALRKFLKLDGEKLLNISHLKSDKAVLIEIAGVGEHALDHLKKLGYNGESEVLIFGAGPIGIMTALALKKENFNLKLIEIDKYRIKIAKELGLKVESTTESLFNEENKMTYKYIIDCSGDGNEKSGFFKYLLHFSSVGAKVLIVGKYKNMQSFNSALFSNRDLTIKWMRGLPIKKFQEVVNSWSSYLEKYGDLIISHRFSTKQISEAFDLALKRSNTMKVIIEIE